MLGHCRLPRSCARTSASVMRAYSERRWPSGDRTRGTAATCRASGERLAPGMGRANETGQDRKSTRLNSSHSQISYAVFCLKKNMHAAQRGQQLGHVQLLAQDFLIGLTQ